MAEIPNHVRRIIAQYLTSLRDHGFQIQDAILFGSYASGQANQWSDIDLALVSSEFEGIRFADKNKIRKITIALQSERFHAKQPTGQRDLGHWYTSRSMGCSAPLNHEV